MMFNALLTKPFMMDKPFPARPTGISPARLAVFPLRILMAKIFQVLQLRLVVFTFGFCVPWCFVNNDMQI